MSTAITRRDPFDLTACDFHKERTVGDWRIERKTIEHESFRQVAPPGTYTGLLHKGAIWMSDVPDEKRDHYAAYYEAHRRGGRMLVHGLGLGMVVKAMLDLPNVEHVDVVELDADVIALCGPAFELYGDRITIHHANAFDKKWPPGTRWQVVWHDIWQTICTDDLDDHARLLRSYGRRSDWQGAWQHERLLSEKRRERNGAWW